MKASIVKVALSSVKKHYLQGNYCLRVIFFIKLKHKNVTVSNIFTIILIGKIFSCFYFRKLVTGSEFRKYFQNSHNDIFDDVHLRHCISYSVSHQSGFHSQQIETIVYQSVEEANFNGPLQAHHRWSLVMPAVDIRVKPRR